MSHVTLLGDSIFDNARYVPGGSPVVEQLRGRLPRGWRATLLAVDGAMADDVPAQLARVPADATHVVVSAGGNDALGSGWVMDHPDLTAAAAFAALADAQGRFQNDYRAMLRAVLAAGRPTAVCTIYDAVPGLTREAAAALSVFNDVILREAFRAGLPVLDLRLVCADPRDYSAVSPIEPSEAGGVKIALGIVGIVTGHDFAGGRTVVYGR